VGTTFDRSATLDHEAWQVTAEWNVTGQSAGFRDAGGAAGGLQLVARLSELRIDHESFVAGSESFADTATSARRALTQAVGVNWLPVTGLKASLAIHHSTFRGGATDGDRPDEDVVFPRLQHAF
jgi:phosphate-selective porin OprO/OprP